LNGPVIAKTPGAWTLANRILGSGAKLGPAKLGVLGVVVAGEEERLAAVGRADEVVHAVAVLGDDHPP
jgi:hypothetical protein